MQPLFPGYKLVQQARPAECLLALHRLSLSPVNPTVHSLSGCSQLMGVLDVCVSPLCCSCVLWSMQSRHVSCRPERQQPDREAGGSGGRKAHFRYRTSFTEQGQVHSIFLRWTLTAPRGATMGHHHCRRDHALWPHSGGYPANPDRPRQPAAGPHSAQSHVLPLTQPDGVQGWRIVGHLGAI